MRGWLTEIRGNRSQYTVASEIGIAQSTYASIESGSRNPSVDMAKKIATALGFDWTRFYAEDGEAAEQETEKTRAACSGQDYKRLERRLAANFDE